MTTHPWFLGTAAVALCVIALAGCGGGGDSSSGTSETQTGSTTSGSSTSLQEFEETVASDVEEAQAPDPAKPPTTGPKAEPGKSVYIISCTFAAEGCARPARAAKAAAEDIGWHPTVIDTQSDPTKASAAIKQAIAAGAAGITINGFDGSQLQGPIEEAEEAGVKVVATLAADPEHIYEDLIPGSLKPDGYVMGELLYQLTKGDVKLVMFTGDEFGVVKERREGTEEFIEDCKAAGGDCEILQQQEVLASELATTVPGLAVSVMRQNPDATAIWTGYDAMATFIIQGLEQAGLTQEGLLVGFDGNTPNLEIIREGGFEKATMGLPEEWIGYQSIDNINRLINGEKPINFPARTKLLTEANLPAEGAYVGDEPNFADGYKKIWGG